MSKKKKKIIIITIVVIIAILITVGVIFLINRKDKEKPVVKEIEVLDKIDGYDYILEDRDTALMKEVFEKLKDVLNNNEIDYNLYAEYLSELFVIDLFTMSNKDNKYDVGGAEYVLENIKDNYKLNVENTIYKYMEEKNKRDNNDYPEVIKINKENIEESIYTYNEEKYNAYNIMLNWEYDKESDYQKRGMVTLINKDNKLYVVKFEGVNEEE